MQTSSVHSDREPDQGSPPVTGRGLAILRAVAAGRAELAVSCEPDLFVDGLCCCDQYTAHQLARVGLVRPAAAGALGQRVRAELTPAGHAMVSAPLSVPA
ncbi:MAG: hypothetical protein ACRDT0_13745 [Pseudonocardiaceae bacterium]